MYPAWELRRLAAHKAALHRRIALRRLACAQAAAQVARPLAWLDRAVALWRRIAPVAAVPLGLLFQRVVAPRAGLLGRLASWGPLLFGAVRGISAWAKAPAAPARDGA